MQQICVGRWPSNTCELWFQIWTETEGFFGYCISGLLSTSKAHYIDTCAKSGHNKGNNSKLQIFGQTGVLDTDWPQSNQITSPFSRPTRALWILTIPDKLFWCLIHIKFLHFGHVAFIHNSHWLQQLERIFSPNAKSSPCWKSRCK